THLFDRFEHGKGPHKLFVCLHGKVPMAVRLGKLNKSVRVYLRLSPKAIKIAKGKLRVCHGRKDSNVLEFPGPMACETGAPHLMAAALVHLKTRVKGTRHDMTYVAIGGCNLIERHGRSARTVVRLADGDVQIRAPFGGLAMLPSRVLVPSHSLAKPNRL